MKQQQAKTKKAGKSVVSVPEVVNYLKNEIKQGNLVPGQRLVEADLTRATGASRSRVRSAFQQLVVEGLVTIEEYRGASVKRYTLDEVRHLYKVRQVLEGLAARTVAENGDQAVMKQIRELQKQMDACEKSRNNVEFARLNEEWHTTIAAGSGNHYLIEFLDRLKIPIFRYLLNMLYEGTVVPEANRDHKVISRAILSGDGDEAEKLMKRHIGDALFKLERDNDSAFRKEM
jgi:DNA-binding GntR family transcriptional regulator